VTLEVGNNSKANRAAEIENMPEPQEISVNNVDTNIC